MEKLTKTITIGVTEKGRCAIKVSPDMDATLALQLTGTLALHLLNAFKSVAIHNITTNSNLKSKDKDIAIAGITDSLYDAADSVFSNVLLEFNPTHPRYTIEDEAILELVNAKIEEKYNNLPDTEKAKYHEAYNKLKLNLNTTKHTTTKSNEKPKND